MGDDGLNGTIGSGGAGGAYTAVLIAAFALLPVFFGAGIALMHFL